MTEEEYWAELVVRFNSVESSSALDLGGWCDGFEPTRYLTTGSSPCVTGRVTFIDGSRTREWKFRLPLDRECSSLAEVDWRGQLPSRDSGWFSVDEVGRRIEIVTKDAP